MSGHRYWCNSICGVGVVDNGCECNCENGELKTPPGLHNQIRCYDDEAIRSIIQQAKAEGFAECKQAVLHELTREHWKEPGYQQCIRNIRKFEPTP